MTTAQTPKFYLDADVPIGLRRILISHGYDVVAAPMVRRGQDDDPTVLAYAHEQNRVLITRNRGDFRRLSGLWVALVRWKQRTDMHTGILSCANTGTPPDLDEWGQSIKEFIEDHGPLNGQMFVYFFSDGKWEPEQVSLGAVPKRR